MAGTLGGGGRGRRGAIIAQINVTPLVDVCLVLLIILMVSSTYIVAQTLKVQLPKARNSDGTADKPVTVLLLRDGTMRWNDQPAVEAEIVAGLKAAMAADPETNVVISADREVQHGHVVHILDIAKTAGVTKFAINVEGGGE
jgi:biopolymer transport protein ExbD